MDCRSAGIAEIRAALSARGIEPANAAGWDRDDWLDLLMGAVVGPSLGHDAPVFVNDYPASQASLARLTRDADGNWEMGDRAKTEAAFAKADRVVKLQIVNNRLVVNSMEPRGAICEYDAKDDRSTLWVSSQGVSVIRPVPVSDAS